jgi:hypothetical protein
MTTAQIARAIENLPDRTETALERMESAGRVLRNKEGRAVGVTLRRLERFWIRAADLVQRPQPLAPGSSSPAQPFFA